MQLIVYVIKVLQKLVKNEPCNNSPATIRSRAAPAPNLPFLYLLASLMMTQVIPGNDQTGVCSKIFGNSVFIKSTVAY